MSSSSSNENLEKAAMLILVESDQFKFVRLELARILYKFRSEEEESLFYSPHYVLDIFMDGSGCVAGTEEDYEDGNAIVWYP